MDANTIITNTKNFEAIHLLFKSNKPKFEVEQTVAISQFKVKDHDVLDDNKRKDKIITKDTGEKDANDNPITIRTTVKVARIGMPFQKLIVNRRVGFMLSDPVKTEAIYINEESEKEKALVEMIDRIQNDNKMDYKNKEIARRMMSEMECAEIWYFVENKEQKPRFTLKVKILSPELGDNLYPLFDNTGDMIAFARGYKLLEDNKEIDHFDVYTADFEYKYVSKENNWILDTEVQSITTDGPKAINPIPNAVKKIMVIYHSQKAPEWDDVQTMIDRQEEEVSNHADMNDYFGSPILAVAGEIMGFAQKGEQGKILQLASEAKANYLALNTPPESIKMELENLEKFIYAMSQTPNISFEQMMKIGGQISGIALKLMFLDAHLAVKTKEETFGIGLQRRLNLIKACIGMVIDATLSEVAKTVQVKPVMTPYLPENETEMIENLSVSKTGGIISTETAIELNPLVADSDVEMERIKNDKTEELAGQEQILSKVNNNLTTQ